MTHFGMGEASNPDNVWYGTPSITILQSKRRQDDEESPHEETRPREDKEDRKRRRVEATSKVKTYVKNWKF